MRDWMGRNADAELHLFQRLLVSQDDARRNLRCGRVEAIRHRLHVLEMTTDQFDEAIVIQVSGSRNDDISRGKAMSVGIHHRLALETLNRLFCSQNWLAKWVILPEIL